MAKHGLKFLIVALPSAVIWWLLSFQMPPPPGMDLPLDRFYFALNCVATAAFFCLLTGVEAVAHDRLFSPAINPLAGYESKRIRVNKQYLQNTLEQTVLFALAVLSFSSACKNGEDMRIVVASTCVWMISRFIFWICYHRNPLDRIYGLIGMLLTMLLLGFSVFHFILFSFGAVAAIFAGILCAAIEGLLTYHSWQSGKIA